MASPATIAAYEKKLDGRASNGGARINSGALPTKKLFSQRFNMMLEQAISKRMGKMVNAQIDAAIGVISEKYDAKNDKYYYVENGPSTAAFNSLTDRALGRPKEKVEHTGAIGIMHLIKQLKDSDVDPGTIED